MPHRRVETNFAEVRALRSHLPLEGNVSGEKARFSRGLAIHPDEVPSGRNEEDGIALADPDAVRAPHIQFH